MLYGTDPERNLFIFRVQAGLCFQLFYFHLRILKDIPRSDVTTSLVNENIGKDPQSSRKQNTAPRRIKKY